MTRSRNKGGMRDAEPLQFRLNQVLIKGFRLNHPQEKKLLILHGFDSAAHKFEHYALSLAAKGYEVLAFDAPAHGESGGTRTNAVEYSDMIRKVAEQFGPVNNFIAHSFGGIALSLALEEMPHDEHTRVVFIAPATETTSAVDTAFSTLKIKNEKVRTEFDRLIFEISGKETTWFSMRRAMHNIRAQVLWVHDEQDEVTPWSDAQKVKEDNHPNINFVTTKGLGHRKIYHDDTIKNAVTGFFQTIKSC